MDKQTEEIIKRSYKIAQEVKQQPDVLSAVVLLGNSWAAYLEAILEDEQI